MASRGLLLVTGGAGYVGSHALRELLERGERVVVVDDLGEGHRSAASGAEIVSTDLAEPSAAKALDEILARGPFDAVLHFAAKAYVGESVRDPAKYYRNNVTAGINLLSAMARNRVPAVIFSSTCATYGTPREVPISETRVGGRAVPHEVAGRRAGDSARLVASPAKAQKELGFQPRFADLDRIVETAWRFQERFPDGYAD